MSFSKYNKEPVSAMEPTKINVEGVKNPKLSQQSYNFTGASIGKAYKNEVDGGYSSKIPVGDDAYAKEKRAEWNKSGA